MAKAIKKELTKKEAKELLKSNSDKLLKTLSEKEEEIPAIDTLYLVNSTENDITLEVLMGGQGQSFDFTITLDDKTLASHTTRNFPEKVIGTNSNLNGKVLRIVGTIMDLSRTTNLTSLTILLKGGRNNKKFELIKNVANEGDVVDYMCRFEFFLS